jgi:hypothetical protein
VASAGARIGNLMNRAALLRFGIIDQAFRNHK